MERAMERAMKRIQNVQQALEELQVDALIISNPLDLFYLTDLDMSAGSLVISKEKALLIVDGRYIERCQKNGQIEVIRQAPNCLSQAIENTKRIGFSADSTTYAAYMRLQADVGEGKELVALSMPIQAIRAVKEPKEIALIETSAKLCIKGLEFLYSRIKNGVTEKALARELEIFWINEGADKLAFEPIIAFGENGSMPHYRAGDTALKEGDAVLIDIGVVLDGYASDMTRMAFYGAQNARLTEIYEVVKLAQEKAIEACRPGITSQDLYNISMDVIEKAGFGEAFLHSLGHGIGLDVHEYPILRRDPKPCVLKAGMVLAIEPGIYLPGVGGVRIEDMVLITENGHRVLTPCPKSVMISR